MPQDGYELTFNCAEPADGLSARRGDQAQNIRYETPFETMPAISTEIEIDIRQHVRRFMRLRAI
jgi:hypothetical protein